MLFKTWPPPAEPQRPAGIDKRSGRRLPQYMPTLSNSLANSENIAGEDAGALRVADGMRGVFVWFRIISGDARSATFSEACRRQYPNQ